MFGMLFSVYKGDSTLESVWTLGNPPWKLQMGLDVSDGRNGNSSHLNVGGAVGESSMRGTPPKINIAPEKWWSEDEFPFGIAYF